MLTCPLSKAQLHCQNHPITDPDAPAVTLAMIVCRCANLSASIRNNPFITSTMILDEALILERELNDWEASLPESWKFTTEEVDGQFENAFNGITHVYRDLWTARVLNNFRWAQILINELLIVHRAHLGLTSSEDDTERKRSLATISRMATDICINVHSQFCKPNIKETNVRNMSHIHGCFLLLFPLAVAGSTLVPEDIHNFAIKMLENIGNTLGIRKALNMVSLTRAQYFRWQKEGKPREGLEGGSYCQETCASTPRSYLPH